MVEPIVDVSEPAPFNVQWDKEKVANAKVDADAKAKADADAKVKADVNPVVKKPDPPKFTKIAASSDKHENEFSTYPFHDLKVGEGFFVASGDIKGDALHLMRKEASHVNDCYSVSVHDANGDEVWENLHIHGFKRNDNPKYDQFGEIVNEFELDSSGNPIRSVSEINHPKYVLSRYFSVKSVTKDDVISGTTKAPDNGVVVTREF